ncbi:unnamed protein product [Cuscuta campestris]|uniref:Uncharacterized protein n=1 Tax=Cuscuta campestris TaxID=132261 RepID=A0A484KQL8_9ASTE|nr:unnamed protein product [Cuscuta campestris]
MSQANILIPHHPSMDPDNGLDPISLHQTHSSENDSGAPELSPDSGKKWPTIPTPKLPPLNEIGWPSVWLPPKSEPRVLTPEEQARLADDQEQQAALDVVIEFLRNQDVAEEEDDEEYDDEYVDAITYENGDIYDMIEEEDKKRFDFFERLFEDSQLMEYYEKNCANGEFRCLVCFAVLEKGWKRFKGCTSLVHHCLSIAKTRKRKAHRAYAVSICKALGWDINKLIHSSDKSSDALGNIDNTCKEDLNLFGNKVNLVDDNTGEETVQKNSNNNGSEKKKSGGATESILSDGDNSKHVEVLSSAQDVETANAKDFLKGLDPAVARVEDYQVDNAPADLKQDKVNS